MPVPSPRNSIRIARGNIADLTANAVAFGEGEILYAIDEDRFYTSTAGSLVAVGAGILSAESIDALGDVDTSTTPPGVGQVLKWDGANWVPADDNNTDAVTSVAGKTGDVTLVKADITDFADGDYATAAQGALADSALQPGDQINAAAGTAAAPGVYFDANTGLYSPGEDQVALSTNGTGRLFVDASGRVGVGSPASTHSLEINTTGTPLSVNSTNSGTNKIVLRSNGTAEGYLGSTASAAFIVAEGSGLERLRITAAGLVGIGTSSPGSLLHVSGANVDTALKVQAGTAIPTIELLRGSNSTFGGDATYDYRLKNEAGNFTLQNGVSSTIDDLVTVTAAGNVGIGTTSPGDLFHVSESSASLTAPSAGSVALFERAANAGITLGTANTGSCTLFFADPESPAAGKLLYDHSTDSLQIYTNGSSERARIDSSGRLLVGNSSSVPFQGTNYLVQVNSANGTEGFAGTNWATGTGGANLIFAKSKSGTVGSHVLPNQNDSMGRIAFNMSDGSSAFNLGATIQGVVDDTPTASSSPGRLNIFTTPSGSTTPAERMRIRSTGQTLIGTPGTSTNNDLLYINNKGATDIVPTSDFSTIRSQLDIQESMAGNDAWCVNAVQSATNGASPYSITDLILFRTFTNGFTGTNGSATNVIGFDASPSLASKGTNNYGFKSNLGAGTGNWNFYAAGYADSYFASNNFIWANGGSERARIDSSGRLLVGTSSSIRGGVLEVARASADTQIQITESSDSGYGPQLKITRTRGSNLGSPSPVENNNSLGGISWTSWDSAAYRIGAEIVAYADGQTWASNDCPTRLAFSTTADGASSPTERVRITSSGYLKVSNSGSYYAVSNPYHEFLGAGSSDLVAHFENTTSTNPYGIRIRFSGASPNDATRYFLNCIDSGSTVRAEIRSNGGLANYQANDVNLSDRNVKKDISPAVGTWDCIKEWEIVNYRYKDQPEDADLNLGVIAQQVAESCPEVITVFQEATEDEPEKLGVKEQQMYWMAIKALQEAMERIETLEAKVAALESA